MAAPRVAYFDIETAPIKGLAWQMFEANIVHVIEPTFMLCYAIKWGDKASVKTRALCDYPDYEKNKYSDKALVTELHEDMSRADIIIAHNGDAFDIKKSNARFLVHGLPPLPPFKTVDTLKVARRHFKFDSNKLDNIGRYLGIGRKLPHTGMDLWIGCMNGDPKAWRMMRRYNAQDVRLLEAVYLKIRSWATTHPDMRDNANKTGCPTCQSQNIQHRGFNVAKTKITQRMQCRGCGRWFAGESVKRAA